MLECGGLSTTRGWVFGSLFVGGEKQSQVGIVVV